jgi:hypothetical protein
VVELGVFPERGDGAERYGDQDGDHRRHDRDLERHRQAQEDLVRNRIARPHGVAEIERDVALEKAEELQDERIVEPELAVTQVHRRLVDMGTARSHADDADVARDEAHENEYQRRRSCQRRDRQQEAGYDVAMHLPRLTSTGLFV